MTSLRRFWCRIPVFLEWIIWPLALLLLLRLENDDGLLGLLGLKAEAGKKMVIVVPFAHDMDVLESNLKRWTRLCPFVGKYPVRKHVDFLFYYHKDYLMSPHKTRIDGLISYVRSLKVFNTVNVISAGLDGYMDTYPLGPSNMFFNLFLSTPLLEDKGYNFLFWMEPDCHPVRNGWLTQLYSAAVRNGPFWMLGSARRGEYDLPKDLEYAKNHMNGNAIYRLDDPNFRAYVEAVHEDFDQELKLYMRSFDIALHIFRRKLRPKYRQTELLHRFLYTDLIHNYWRTAVSVAEILERFPVTYLVHGRNVKFE